MIHTPDTVRADRAKLDTVYAAHVARTTTLSVQTFSLTYSAGSPLTSWIGV